ncbi:Cpn10 domain-containing protein [Cephalotus follicularis]|uniref:Cpn10 domain-containing protein n=1 Tax=Cephalotus follicularis TaxID=3775 RepID=A0A1Q3BV16_CEPFO|nr:Cpn10 domain-containing protein [Cephalotus follicularis]
MAMASTFVAVPKPFLFNKTNVPSLSNHTIRQPVSQRQVLRINAIAKKWEPTKVVPQADRVLVRLEQLPEKSAGGVLLPKSAVKFERYLMGEILAVGSDVGEVQAGKKVLFSDISAYEVDLGSEDKHCFCKESDLLAVVE